jgi:uncharacterized protein (DUF849 family)
MSQILRLKACLNGPRRVGAHPALPVTPAQLAADARAVAAVGAEAVHMHPRNSDGVESLRAGDIGGAVRAVRSAVGGMPIGVSTGLWVTGRDVELRQTVVASWSAIEPADRPDFASVNVGEPGFAELAGTLQTLGIDVEPGVWTVDDADALALVTPDRPWIRVLVEIMRATDPPAEADAILTRLDDRHVTGPRLLHGEGAACWPLVAYAARLGLPTRIGLEDTLTGQHGATATDNAALVVEALRTMSA